MRTDEAGNSAPATLGEYFDLCEALEGGRGSGGAAACRLLKEKIGGSPGGRDEEVIASDSQVRQLLMPLLAKTWEHE